MSTVISEETHAAIDQAEPNFSNEPAFTIEDTPAPKRGGPGRGHKGARSHHRKPPAAAKPPIVMVPEPPAEPPKSLVRGCRWMLRNVVTVMKEGYGWDEPEDFEEWLIEASQLGASCVQKHFPDWMDRWGDEIILLAMVLVWVTPNVSRELRKRKKPDTGDAGAEGQREDNPTMSFVKSA